MTSNPCDTETCQVLSPRKKSALGLSADPRGLRQAGVDSSLHRGLFRPGSRSGSSSTPPRRLRRTESPSCELTSGLRPHDHQWVLTRLRSMSTGPFPALARRDRNGAKCLRGTGSRCSALQRPGAYRPSCPWSHSPWNTPRPTLPNSRAASPPDSRSRAACAAEMLVGPVHCSRCARPAAAVLQLSLGRATALGCAGSAVTPRGPWRRFPRLLPTPWPSPQERQSPCCKPPAERGAFRPPELGWRINKHTRLDCSVHSTTLFLKLAPSRPPRRSRWYEPRMEETVRPSVLLPHSELCSTKALLLKK